MNPLATARGAAFQSFVRSTAGNANAITLASRVPQAIGTGFGYTIFDLRSIQNDQWASAAPMEAALIYFVRRHAYHTETRSSLLSTLHCSKAWPE